ncbi:hypothetical protein C3495_05805 [Clostridiaceae bacterium 14S0207]|nr:hypothetical protein C3495_05805 [Clostridiaceae bacterium 14S0207]
MYRNELAVKDEVNYEESRKKDFEQYDMLINDKFVVEAEKKLLLSKLEGFSIASGIISIFLSILTLISEFDYYRNESITLVLLIFWSTSVMITIFLLY